MIYRRIYAVPDSHGRNDLLQFLLQKLDQDGYDKSQDLLIFLGDMIDRGPDSKGVIDTIISLQKDNPNVIALRGNHDQFAISAMVQKLEGAQENWDYNGGYATHQSYPNGYMSEEHLKWIGGLPFHFETQGFYFSHAPVPSQNQRSKNAQWSHGKVSYPDQEYTIYDRTWTFYGDEVWKDHKGPLENNGLGPNHLIGICGHIHALRRDIMEPRIFKNYRMLDSGCGCSPKAPLIAHECISGKTLFASPKELYKDN